MVLSSTSGVQVVYGSGSSGGFTAPSTLTVSGGGATSVTALALADIDEDGELDIVVGTGGVCVLRAV